MEKYRNKRIVLDGIRFDSKKELRRYHELMLLEKAGTINGLERQKKYVLIPAQKEPNSVGVRGGIRFGKTLEKECAYIADFVYQENGQTVVEDVKGYKKGGAYAVFTIKRKLMLERYDIRVREV